MGSQVEADHGAIIQHTTKLMLGAYYNTTDLVIMLHGAIVKHTKR